ncbi:MAG: capsular polysaccharide biosynthesis protein [Verrucomicrobiales bacterium]|nr:capsular polysaccharide biosynthesis protein [Verrucomicrobiales bacterium]
MLTNRASGLYRIHAGAQIVLAVAWLVLLHAVLNLAEPWGAKLPGPPYISYALIVAAALVGEAWSRPERLRWLTELSRRNRRRISLRQFVAVALVLSLFLVSTQDQHISRRFFAIFILGCLPLFHISNYLLPARLLKMVMRIFEKKKANILVLEDRKAVMFFDRRIKSGVYPGMEVSGYLTLRQPEFKNGHAPRHWLGTLNDLETVAREHSIKQVVMPSLCFEPRVGREVRRFCESQGIRLVLINDAPRRLGCRLTMTDIGGMEILSPRSEPLEDPINQTIKRLADIVFAIGVLLTVFPLTTLFALICHRAQSPGPLFFTQERTGRGGHKFRIYKYRSLHVDNGDETKQVSLKDDRVFPLGRLMRKTSIDEIPQFINVLKGEMSLVGPRPHLPAHDEKFADISSSYYVRTFVKPGITGLAQVKGFRGETKTRNQVRNRTRWDLIYLEMWSPAMDIWIVIRTALQVLRPPKGAA